MVDWKALTGSRRFGLSRRRRLFGRRRLFAGAAALMLACVGCESSHWTAAGPARDAHPSSIHGTLRVLDPVHPTTPEGKDALGRVIAAFHKTYPHVSIQVDITTYANLNQKVATSIASGQPYDVYITGIGWIPPFAAKGLYTNMAKFGLSAAALAREVNPAIVKAATYNGAVYGLPLILQPRVLAYRKSDFRSAGLDPNKPPTSFAQLEKDATLLTKRSSSGRVIRSGLDFFTDAGNYRQTFVAFDGAAGGPLYGAGGSKPAFDNANGVRGLTAMQRLIVRDKVTDFGLMTSDGQPLVLSGGAAMGFMTPYVDCSAHGVGAKVCHDLAFTSIVDKDAATFSGGEIASVAKSSHLQAAAYSFVRALASSSSEVDMSTLAGGIPAAKSAVDSPFVNSNPASRWSAQHESSFVFEGGPASWIDTRDAFGPALDSVLLGTESPSAALAHVASQSY